MSFVLGKASRDKLNSVHPDLVKVVELAIQLTTVDFRVLEGKRTTARQKQLVEAGASWTMNSRHLTGHAVDLGALLNGKIRWDWPLYHKIAEAMFAASKQLGIPIVWGGDWDGDGDTSDERKPDGPHFQLPWNKYP